MSTNVPGFQSYIFKVFASFCIAKLVTTSIRVVNICEMMNDVLLLCFSSDPAAAGDTPDPQQ